MFTPAESMEAGGGGAGTDAAATTGAVAATVVSATTTTTTVTANSSHKPRHKVRFVCVSDTHNRSPRDGAFKLPPGDVLVHAGDLTNQGTLHELRAALDWIAAAKGYAAKIVIAGNHDITLDEQYYEKHKDRHHSRYPQPSAECRALARSYPSITYLEHESATITLDEVPPPSLSSSTSPPVNARPSVSFTIFGSPYSPGDGGWAFGYARFPVAGIDPDEVGISSLSGSELWSAIPDGTDIVVTHTPPLGYRDAGRGNRSCPDLLRALARVRPALAICGHAHDGWGADLVSWADEPAAEDLEAMVKASSTLDLPRIGKKVAKIDLTREMRTAAPPTASSDIDVPRAPLGDLEKQGSRTSTCIINCAIKGHTKFSKDSSGPMNNKPILVDIEIPILRE